MILPIDLAGPDNKRFTAMLVPAVIYRHDTSHPSLRSYAYSRFAMGSLGMQRDQKMLYIRQGGATTPLLP